MVGAGLSFTAGLFNGNFDYMLQSAIDLGRAAGLTYVVLVFLLTLVLSSKEAFDN